MLAYEKDHKAASVQNNRYPALIVTFSFNTSHIINFRQKYTALARHKIHMPALADLYIRTPQGRATAFNPLAVLPAPLKALLKAVDGKVATNDLLTAHAKLGDVAKLLAILQSNGLIADKHAAFAKVSDARAGAGQFVDSQNPLLDSGQSGFDPRAKSDFSNTESGVWSNTSPSDLEAPRSKQDGLLDRMAQQVADSMATFVLTHMPHRAFAELQTIEKIFTPDQLKAELPKYEILVQSLGAVGEQHFFEISKLASKLMET